MSIIVVPEHLLEPWLAAHSARERARASARRVTRVDSYLFADDDGEPVRAIVADGVRSLREMVDLSEELLYDERRTFVRG